MSCSVWIPQDSGFVYTRAHQQLGTASPSKAHACPRLRCPRLFPRPGRTRSLFSLFFARYFKTFGFMRLSNYSCLGLRVAVQGFDGACSLEVAPTKRLGVSLSGF